MSKNNKNQLEETIANLMKENIAQRNESDQSQLVFERKLDDIGADLIQIMDAFEKAEERIKDRGLDQDESSQKAIKQLLLAKRKTEAIFEKYRITKVEFPDGIADDNYCEITGTVPDSDKPEGTIISIGKNGYLRDGRLIRRAEVEIVKN